MLDDIFFSDWEGVMVFNATFNNIAVIMEKRTVTSKKYYLSKIIKAKTIFKKKDVWRSTNIIFFYEQYFTEIT